ncbi:uncharacterized protein GJ701_006294 [Geothlypis trichas]
MSRTRLTFSRWRQNGAKIEGPGGCKCTACTEKRRRRGSGGIFCGVSSSREWTETAELFRRDECGRKQPKTAEETNVAENCRIEPKSSVGTKKGGEKQGERKKKRVGVKTKGHSGGAVLPQVLPRRGAKDPFDALAALQQPVAGNGEVAVSPRLQLPAGPAAGAASDATADAPREWLAGRGGRAPGERAVRGELPAPLPRGTEPRQRRWRGEASVRPPARSWAARKGRPPGSSASLGGTGGGGSARARRGALPKQTKGMGEF